MSTTTEPKSFYDFKAQEIMGQKEIDFNQFRNQVVIVVNSASHCGYTKSNYTGLSKLLDEFSDKGLRVLLFPCNQFANQERDDPKVIKAFVEAYDGRFIVAEKVHVNGSDSHPLWAWLKEHQHGFLFDAIKWNFTKFVINRKGEAVARFAPNDEPEKMRAEIEKLINEKP